MSIETHPNESLTATFPSHVHRINSSEITDLFTVNTPPNDIQRISLDAAIVRRTTDIANLYASLDECKRLHSRLREEIFLAKTDVGCIKAVTHPVRLMPSELLLEIFKYGRKGKFNTCVSPADELWRCAQVCKHWRDICLATPALWTNVHLNFYSNSGQLLLDKEVTRYALRILDKRLSRTRNRPINITIMAPQLHIADNPLIHCIVCRCERWHSFSMDAPLQTWQSMNVCEGSLYELTSLKIADSSYLTRQDAAYSNEIISSFTFLPKIEILSISDVPLRALTASPAAFHGLKQFEVHLHRQAAEVFDLLPHMTSVTSLDISCDADVGEFHWDIVIPSVTSLILRDGESMDGLPIVWSMLRLKNLRDLKLTYEGNIMAPIWPLLMSMQNGITSLNISYTASVVDAEYHDNAALALMRWLPNLTSLHLTVPSFRTQFFDELRQKPRFLPCLVDLKYISWDIQSDEDIACIAYMLLTRRLSLECESVTTLTLHHSDPLSIHDPITPNWETLLQTGLRVLFI